MSLGENMAVWIEESPTSRAECRVCHKPISKGEKRVGEDDTWRGFWSPRYYHLECWIRQNKEFIKDLLQALRKNGFEVDSDGKA